MKIGKNAMTVLERRYLMKDEEGKNIETVEQLFWRVARAIAEALCYLALRAGDRVCFACLRGAETLESPLFAGRAAYEKASAFLDGVHPAGRTRLGERGAAVRVRGARGMAVVLSDLFSEDDWTRCPTAARWQNSSPARRIGATSTPCAMRRWPRTRICSPRCSARSRARG